MLISIITKTDDQFNLYYYFSFRIAFQDSDNHIGAVYRTEKCI